MESVQETWLPVKGYEGFYEVSNQGRVRSLPRVCRNGAVRGGKTLKTPANSWGYALVGLSVDGKVRYASVHSLVAKVFVFPQPPGTEVNHKNGVKTDNRAENLEWITSPENLQHSKHTGLTLSCERHKKAKLTPEQVADLRRKWLDGTLSPSAEARRLGVDKSTIERAAKRRTWTRMEASTN